MRSGAVVLLAAVFTLAACGGQGQPTGSGGGTAGAPAPTLASRTARASSPAASSQGPVAVPRPDHVVVVMLENHAQGQVIGNPAAPYINSLVSIGASMTRSYGVTHPSQPNYLAQFSGSTQGVRGDGCPNAFSTPNLASELLAGGDSFVGYSEGLPAVGSTVCAAGAYARKHAPWTNWPTLPVSVNQPFSDFPRSYADLPDVAYVIPNLDHDMHDGTVAQADAWLQAKLSGYVSWARTHHSWFVLTFDEDDQTPVNRIPTILVGDGIRPGQYSQRIDHYDILRTLEDAFGLTPLGESAHAAPITGIWSP